HADWAVLGLWRDGSLDEQAIEISSVYTRETGASLDHAQIPPEHFPPMEQLPTSVCDSLEYLIKLTPLASSGRRWGYLAYAERFIWTFNDMVRNRNTYITAALEREELLASLHERQATLTTAALEREELLASLHERQATLQEAYDRERN